MDKTETVDAKIRKVQGEIFILKCHSLWFDDKEWQDRCIAGFNKRCELLKEKAHATTSRIEDVTDHVPTVTEVLLEYFEEHSHVKSRAIAARPCLPWAHRFAPTLLELLWHLSLKLQGLEQKTSPILTLVDFYSMDLNELQDKYPLTNDISWYIIAKVNPTGILGKRKGKNGHWTTHSRNDGKKIYHNQKIIGTRTELGYCVKGFGKFKTSWKASEFKLTNYRATTDPKIWERVQDAAPKDDSGRIWVIIKVFDENVTLA